jgi:hypothetical protein
VRLVDAVFRQGHLSERALVEALLTGDRPPHLDRCDVCTERAIAIDRWLAQVRSAGIEAADAVFPPERLAAQQAQILRRIEHLDQPARVIAFPGPRAETADGPVRRVAPAWVGVAAAAGLVLGLIGGQITARLGGESRGRSTERSAAPAAPLPVPPGQPVPSFFEFDLENSTLRGAAVGVLDDMTPRALETMASSRAGG